MIRHLLAAALGLVVACQAAAFDYDPATGVSLDRVRYRLTWDATGTEPAAGGGWTTTTDLGYEVEVTRGYLVSYAVTLAQCESTATASLLPVAPAMAWHGEANDPSIAGDVVEPMVGSRELDLDVAFDAADYCRVFYLVAAADGATSHLPDDVGMELTSLYLEGSWRAPGGAWTPFAVRTELAGGVLEEIGDVLVDLTDGTGADVEIQRPMATLFDGITWPDATDDVVAWDVLSNLRGGTLITATVGD